MNLTLPSVDLKRLLKKLSPVSADLIAIDLVHGAMYAEKIASVLVQDIVLKSSDAMELDSPIAVSSSLFSSVVSKTSGEVNLSILGKRMVVRSKKATFELPVQMASFPPVLPLPSHKLPLKVFLPAMLFAVGGSDSKDFKTSNSGVNLVSAAGTLRMEATDGSTRLRYIEIPSEECFSFLCPANVVQCMQSLDGETVDFGYTDLQVFFYTPGVTVFGQRVTSAFPAYKHLIPKAPVFVVELDAEQMTEGLDTVGTTVAADNQNAYHLTMRFGFKPSECLLCTTDGIAKSEDYVKCAVTTPNPDLDPLGAHFVTTVDHKSVRAFFSQIKGTVQMQADAEDKPLLFSAGNRKILISTLVKRK
jgi:DNA polymerase III sliding clamp (beta) subunit (PCNA family)